jgi:hypothetical protein
MSRLAVRAELIKLARTLDTDPESLDFLADHDAESLTRLREGVSDGLFKRHASSFRLLANLSGLLPTMLTAKVAQFALGAFLAGRVTGEMQPDTAVSVAKKLPAEFLADVSMAIDPARAEPVIAAMPAKTVEAVAEVLTAREEYITMGRFVGAISEQALYRVIDNLEDAELLHIGFYVEDASRLDSILEYLPEDRLRNIVNTATRESLWPEALSFIQMVGDEQKGRLGDLTAGEDDAVLDSLIHVAQEQSLWPEVLVAAASMQPDNQTRVVNLPSLTDRNVLDSIIAATHAQDMWSLVLPLVARMSQANQTAAMDAALSQDDEVIAAWLNAAGDEALADQAVPVLENLPEAQRSELLEKMRRFEKHQTGPAHGTLMAALGG